jgi:GLPGLI family protein
MFQKLFFIACSAIVFMISENIYAQSVSQYSNLERYIGRGSIAVLDSAKFCFTYSLDYVPDSTKPKEVYKDRKILLVGNTVSHFYSYYVRQADSAYTADKDMGKRILPVKNPDDIREEGYEIFIHYPTLKKQTVIEPITDWSIYKYEEEIEMPQWTLSSDTCTILSYACKKATAHFRGRNWTVWYSLSIPLSAGPWKLNGLPGLILRAVDERNHFAFECIGIEQYGQNKQAVIMGKWHYIECSRADYRKAQKKFYNDYVNTLLSLGYNIILHDATGGWKEVLKTPNREYEITGVSRATGIDAADRYKQYPYNPIELE